MYITDNHLTKAKLNTGVTTEIRTLIYQFSIYKVNTPQNSTDLALTLNEAELLTETTNLKEREDLSEKKILKKIPLQRHMNPVQPTQVMLVPHHWLSLT